MFLQEPRTCVPINGNYFKCMLTPEAGIFICIYAVKEKEKKRLQTRVTANSFTVEAETQIPDLGTFYISI